MKKLYEVEKEKLDIIVEVKAWVRYVRKASSVIFLQCYDGTTIEDVQVVAAKHYLKEVSRGDYIQVKAEKIESRGTQDFELKVLELQVLSKPKEYPIEKKDSSLVTLREIPQYRTKTKMFSSVTKLKSKVELEIQKYFMERSYTKVTPPLITPSDCEGAGEVFSLGKEFFGKEAYLTVSSQMYLESMVRSFSKVYSLAPAFRADPSLSPRHLAEFWMLECETLTESIDEVIDESIALIKKIGEILLDEKELLKLIDQSLIEDIEYKLKQEFKRITYKEACELLKVDSIKGSVEESLLMEKLDSSVVLTHFPKEMKPFYMKEYGEDTLSFDVLVPGVGEIIGGSLREEDSVVLKERMSKELSDVLSWYLDMRDVDKVMSGGFGLGFERIFMYYLGIESIKDICTIPRWKGRMDI